MTEAELDELRDLVRALESHRDAGGDVDGETCNDCERSTIVGLPIEHAPDCRWRRAMELLEA